MIEADEEPCMKRKKQVGCKQRKRTFLKPQRKNFKRNLISKLTEKNETRESEVVIVDADTQQLKDDVDDSLGYHVAVEWHPHVH